MFLTTLITIDAHSQEMSAKYKEIKEMKLNFILDNTKRNIFNVFLVALKINIITPFGLKKKKLKSKLKIQLTPLIQQVLHLISINIMSLKSWELTFGITEIKSFLKKLEQKKFYWFCIKKNFLTKKCLNVLVIARIRRKSK